ncbi:hypothetical protein [Pseudomonas sp.]|uniref:hypothetical protein n=1 Tax=Pseudomonas sp. TaxID=306 RepID=UPI0028AA587F|nr:hypothetical protein [Pseudomonas sp.]
MASPSRFAVLVSGLIGIASLAGCQSTDDVLPRRPAIPAPEVEPAPPPSELSAALQIMLPRRLVEQRSPALGQQLQTLGEQLASHGESSLVTIVTTDPATFDYLQSLIAAGAGSSPSVQYALQERPDTHQSLVLVSHP